MTDEDRYAQTFVGVQDEPVPIPWAEVDPACLPDGSLVRAALEEGRTDVAAWLASKARGAAYLHGDATYRRLALEDRARQAVRSGSLSARRAEQRYGVDRRRLSPQ